MSATRIEEGARLSVGILGSDLHIEVYLIEEDAGPYTKAGVIAQIPGTYGEASQEAPNAVLVRKEYGGFITVDPNGSWKALGYAIYRSNNGFGGGPRPVSSYAREWRDFEIPRYFEDVPGSYWRYSPFKTLRQHNTKVAQRTVDELNEDILTEKIDKVLRKVCRFNNDGIWYRLIGADTRWAPGSPKIVEYRFETTGEVPAYPKDGDLGNAIDIPKLPHLADYVVVEKPGVAPTITVLTADKQYGTFIPGQELPGY